MNIWIHPEILSYMADMIWLWLKLYAVLLRVKTSI